MGHPPATTAKIYVASTPWRVGRDHDGTVWVVARDVSRSFGLAPGFGECPRIPGLLTPEQQGRRTITSSCGPLDVNVVAEDGVRALFDRQDLRLARELHEEVKRALDIVTGDPWWREKLTGIGKAILAPYQDSDELIADIRRQQAIVDAARRALDEAGKPAPDSGSEYYAAWYQRVLSAAGETYTIHYGQRVAL